VITPSLDALGLHTDRMGAGTLQREVWSGFSRFEQIGPDLHTIDEDMSDHVRTVLFVVNDTVGESTDPDRLCRGRDVTDRENRMDGATLVRAGVNLSRALRMPTFGGSEKPAKDSPRHLLQPVRNSHHGHYRRQDDR
jgi:hypothetical protein